MPDYAIIIGLQNYPGLGQPELAGPENDAIDFKDWVENPEGGNVPSGNVELILSSHYSPLINSPSLVFDTRPAILDVVRAFEKLRHISIQNQNNGLGPKVGRRLYLFMSGHGIAPTPYGNKVTKETGLLMSNVDPTNIGASHYHLPGAYAANWLSENEFFEEVFLFMDCCRDLVIVQGLNMFFPPKGNSDKAKLFYAFATKWSRRARERLIDGKVQGIFTKTLLMGLYGAAADPDEHDPTKGVITGASSRSYLYQNMKEFIDPQYKGDTQIQEPDIEYYPRANDGKDIIINTVPLQKFPVKFHIPPGASGSVKISYNGLIPFGEILINQSPTSLTYKLPRGGYSASVTVNNNTRQSIFDVKGIEEPSNEGLVDLTV